jgi:hypothetical protein
LACNARKARRESQALTPERLEATFASDLNGERSDLPGDFPRQVLRWLRQSGYLTADGRRTAKADLELGEFWAIEPKAVV